MKQVLIIGGGASGLMAAITAARNGAKVTLLEKNRQTGKKLLVTGNGRCNFTNRNQELSNYRTDRPDLVKEALESFSVDDTVDFFESLGILTKERNGYLYPGSGQASSIADVLRLTAVKEGVKITCDTKALAVKKINDRFAVETEGWTYEADALILACGSKAAPETGSDGDGYTFAESMGHTVVDPLPALTGLCVAEKDGGKAAGVRADGAVTLQIGEEKYCESGELQFTSYGLSGIPVFQISRYAARALNQGIECSVTLDLCPLRKRDQVLTRLKDRRAYTQERRGAAVLLGMFPDKLCSLLLERAGISLKKQGGDWTDEDCERLAAQIKGLHFTISRCRGYEQAQICTGGVPLTELDHTTMESRRVPGLYLTGELIDVDGACGGYNLQWAWTSGYLAGRAAAQEQKGIEVYA